MLFGGRSFNLQSFMLQPADTGSVKGGTGDCARQDTAGGSNNTRSLIFTSAFANAAVSNEIRLYLRMGTCKGSRRWKSSR